MIEEEIDRIISEFGLEDSEDTHEALYEAFMLGAMAGKLDSDVFREALGYFDDEDEDEG